MGNKKNLGDMFTEYGSDKNQDHKYAQYYEKHLPETVNTFMEIGVWTGGGIKAFKEYYSDKGEFHVINYIFGGEIISIEELAKMNVIAHEGKQEDVDFLKTIKTKFTVIVEDGSHHSDSQIITLKQMFINNIEDGGYYILEDVHCCTEDYWWRSIKSFDDTALAVFKRYLDGGTLESQLISKEESDELMSLIESVNIYDDKIIFIKKKG